MLKYAFAGALTLVLTSSAFSQDKSATKPVVFVAGSSEKAQISAAINPEASSELLSECSGVQISTKEDGSDYTLRMSAQDGSKSQLQVLNAAGVIVASGLAGDLKNAVKDACSIVLSDFFSNGKASQPVLAPEQPMAPVPALGADTNPVSAVKSVSPVQIAPLGAAAPVADVAVVPMASEKQPMAPQAPSTTQPLGTIRGTTVSVADPNATYQASESQQQQTESLGEIARRNRAAKATHQQQAQQAQNDVKPDEKPH